MVSKSGCVGWLQKRTNLEKTLLSLSSLLLLTLLLMILIGITYHGGKTENSPSGDETCWSKECISTAGNIMESMDSKADSCGNFYDYACGKYGQEPGQTASIAKRSTESLYFSLKRLMESEQKIDVVGLEDLRRFYGSCIKFGSYRQAVEETRKNLLNLMTEVGVGVWPIIDSDYDTSKFSISHTLASLILLDVPVVFRMEIIPDEVVAGSYILKISPGGPRETGRTSSEIRSDGHLRSSVLTSLLLIGASAANTDVDDIISVESSFAIIEQDDDKPCDKIMLSPQEATSELNRLVQEVDWTHVLSEIRNATGLVRPFAVELHCKRKIRDYLSHLSYLTERSEISYLGWRFFSTFVEHVVPTFEKSQFETGEVNPRWRVCLELLEKFSSPVLVDLLAKKIINDEIQEEVEKISTASLNAANRLVSGSSWLTEQQKSGILKKVSRIRPRYPFKRMTSSLNMTLLNIGQVDVSNFTSVVIHQQRKWVIQRFRRLSQEAGTSGLAESWTPLLTAESDSPASDYILSIYADKIRNPYIRSQGSQWMKYGGFGIFVAREISKLLTTLNTRQEESSILWNVWLKSRNSSRCLQRHMDARIDALAPKEYEKMLKDLILDQSAIEIAYEASKSTTVSSKTLPGLKMSDEMLFFLSYAQTQCEADMQSQKSEDIPARARLNSAVHNLETFNKAYSCASSSYCEVWA